MQDGIVHSLKDALAAKPDVPVWNPSKIVVFKGAIPDVSSLAMVAMLSELAIPFESESSTEFGPVLDEDGMLFWDTRSAITVFGRCVRRALGLCLHLLHLPFDLVLSEFLVTV